MKKQVTTIPVLITVYLRAIENTAIPPFAGEGSRHAFFAMLGESEIATILHEIPGLKPYAIKPLRPIDGKKKVKNDRWVIREGTKLAFDIGILDPGIEDRILTDIVSMKKETLNICGATFYLEYFEVYKRSSYEDLLPGKTTSFIGVCFRTPTRFSSRPHLYPDPTQLFKNLLNIWNTYAEEEERIDSENFLDWISDRVDIRYYSLKTREVKIKNAKIVGFKGKTAYVIMDPEFEEAEYILGLLRLGLISNVGQKRTYGLGVITAKDLVNNENIDLAK